MNESVTPEGHEFLKSKGYSAQTYHYKDEDPLETHYTPPEKPYGSHHFNQARKSQHVIVYSHRDSDKASPWSVRIGPNQRIRSEHSSAEDAYKHT